MIRNTLGKIAQGLGFDKSWSGGTTLPPLPPSESTLAGGFARLFGSARASAEDAQWYIKHYKAQVAAALPKIEERAERFRELRQQGKELAKQAMPFKGYMEKAKADLAKGVRGYVDPMVRNLYEELKQNQLLQEIRDKELSIVLKCKRLHELLIAKLELCLAQAEITDVDVSVISRMTRNSAAKNKEYRAVVSALEGGVFNSEFFENPSLSEQSINEALQILGTYDVSAESLNQEHEALREQRRLHGG